MEDKKAAEQRGAQKESSLDVFVVPYVALASINAKTMFHVSCLRATGMHRMQPADLIFQICEYRPSE